MKLFPTQYFSLNKPTQLEELFYLLEDCFNNFRLGNSRDTCGRTSPPHQRSINNCFNMFGYFWWMANQEKRSHRNENGAHQFIFAVEFFSHKSVWNCEQKNVGERSRRAEIHTSFTTLCRRFSSLMAHFSLSMTFMTRTDTSLWYDCRAESRWNIRTRDSMRHLILIVFQ